MKRLILGIALVLVGCSSDPVQKKCHCTNCKCTDMEHCGCMTGEGCKCTSAGCNCPAQKEVKNK